MTTNSFDYRQALAPTTGSVILGDDGIASFADTYKPSITDLTNLKAYNDSLGFDFGSAFDIGADIIGGITGVLGTWDSLKTNKLKRKGLAQNIQFSADAMARTKAVQEHNDAAFRPKQPVQGTPSAFA